MKKGMFLKKTVVVGSALMLSMATMTGHANVAKAEPIVRAVQNHRINPSLNINNGSAICRVSVRAKDTTTKVEGTVTLQKVEGNTISTVRSWSIKNTLKTFSDEKTVMVTKGSYKLIANSCYKGI